MDLEFFDNRILLPLQEWARFGEETNTMGTRLIGHAPHIGPRAFVNIVYAPLSPIHFAEFCERIGREVPQELGSFLKFANGLVCLSDELRLFGYVPIQRDADTALYNYPPSITTYNVSARMPGLSDAAIVVGFYKRDGSYVSIEDGGEVVRFDAHGSGALIMEWPDFDSWLSSEIARLSRRLKSSPEWSS